MSYFKRLFCKHSYIHYHNEIKYALLEIGGTMSPYFVCSKCGKTDFIYGSWLSDSIKEAKNEEQKNIALGKDMKIYDDYTLNINGICSIDGFVAFYVRKKHSHIFK